MEVSPAQVQFIKNQLPAFLWALLIFISSATPSDEFPAIDIWWLPKLIHVIYFSMLCYFVHRALSRQGRYPGLSRWSLPLSVLITFLYAVSDETHQLFVPGRHPEVSDVLLDTASGILFVGTTRLTTLWHGIRKGARP